MNLFYNLRKFFEKNKDFFTKLKHRKEKLVINLKTLDKNKLKQEYLSYSASSKNGA